ncbi:MAG: prolyl-tRNA synthetase associated domain-containing protein [Christensenellales bacterium]|jgi:Ala-tRNA(Pro) deacylase
MSNKQQALSALDALSIPYTYYEHAPAHSMEDCAEFDRMFNIPSDVSHCKNIFLSNRQRTAFYLALIDGDKRFSTKDFCKSLYISRVSFAKEEDLMELLGCYPGSASPLGLIFDTQRRITLVCDESLKGKRSLLLHPLDNTATVEIARSDFFDVFLKHTGHVPVFTDTFGDESAKHS